MTTTTMPADTAEPLSSHRDDPDPSPSAEQADPSDPEPPEPASESPAPSEPRPPVSGLGEGEEHEGNRFLTGAALNAPDPSDDDPEITITASDDVGHDIDFLWLDGHLHNVSVHLAAPIERVSIRIVGDSEMTDLNRRFHDADETTDVLTFCNTTPGEPIDADLALCADEAVRQSSARGHAVERELLLYAVHGLLHCCGQEDGDDKSFAAMHAEEDRILEAIGVGATFNERGGSRA